MGNSNTVEFPQEILLDYVQLTYLNKYEIRYIYKLLDELAPGEMKKNIDYRFTKEQIDKILPQICRSPFRDSIYRVFSSKEDDHLGYEDVLDICSAFNENCPLNVRAGWAFQIFDFDGDNQISHDDLIEAIQRLTQLNECGQIENGIGDDQVEHVARMILKEMDLTQIESISFQEFERFIARMPDFAHSFCFKI